MISQIKPGFLIGGNTNGSERSHSCYDNTTHCQCTFLNLLHKKDRTIKIIAIITAVVLPIIPLLTPYGSHFSVAIFPWPRIQP